MDDLLLARYDQQPVVRDRNRAALILWAGGVTAQPIPGSKPSEDEVRQRIVAERIPVQPSVYADRTLAFFQQDQTTQTNIRQYLNPFNDEATEVALGAQLNAIIGGFMPRFARTEVSNGQVEQWYRDNGFAEPES